MLLTAFSGPLLARMVINGLQDGLDLGNEFKSVLRDIAKTVPVSTRTASDAEVPHFFSNRFRRFGSPRLL